MGYYPWAITHGLLFMGYCLLLIVHVLLSKGYYQWAIIHGFLSMGYYLLFNKLLSMGYYQ